MPANAKTLESSTKHYTNVEKAAIEAAQAAVMPEREAVCLRQPKLMVGDTQAKKYWDSILKRMADVEILDDLDAEVLGVYCVMLSRYEALLKTLRATRKDIARQDLEAKGLDKLLARLEDAEKQTNKTETQILQYAEKLGLTPASRARLAKQRAEQLEDEVDGDLFA